MQFRSLSGTIHLRQRCRQGCPASPELFSSFIEPLAQAIRQDLQGVTIRGSEYKVCLHANDVLISLGDPELGVPRLMELLQTYCDFSGYILNIEKTQALVFNVNTTVKLKTKFKFNCGSSSIKYLGVVLTKDLSALYAKNDQLINAPIKEDLVRWASLPLDLGNRIMVIKTNILPSVLYLFQSLPIQIPESQFREWDKSILCFVWNSEAPRIRY